MGEARLRSRLIQTLYLFAQVESTIINLKFKIMCKTIHCVRIENNMVFFNREKTGFFMTTDYEIAKNEFNRLFKELNGFDMTDMTFNGCICKSFLFGKSGEKAVVWGAEGWIEDDVIYYPDPSKEGQGKLLRIPF